MRRTSVSITCHRLSDEERRERRLGVYEAQLCETGGKAEPPANIFVPGPIVSPSALLFWGESCILSLYLLIYLPSHLSRSASRNSFDATGGISEREGEDTGEPHENLENGGRGWTRYAREFAE